MGNEIFDKAKKSICKIYTQKDKENSIFTIGFFMTDLNSIKYLVTNYQYINPELVVEKIEIEKDNKKKIELNLNEDDKKYFKEQGITIIELENNNSFYNDVEFLYYDLNFKYGYNIYKDAKVFSIDIQFEKEAKYVEGKIIKINNDKFEHDLSFDSDSRGNPVILLNTNFNILQVIGIIINTNKKKEGNFLGEVIDKLNENENIKDNYIIAKINIEDNNLNQDIRIINSYEEYMRKSGQNLDMEDSQKNEEKIKCCEIQINEELIPFNYFFKFNQKGEYTIKYSFKKYMSKINYMFKDCFLTDIDLSHFNTKKVSDMRGLFYGCSYLKIINVSTWDTPKVTNMEDMFNGCSSLEEINLSNFITSNVTSMDRMFFGCSSLEKINLNEFETKKIKEFNDMFTGCKGLQTSQKENIKIKDRRIKEELDNYFDGD